MAWVEPDTEVRLLRGVPLHKGLQHTIFWSNIGDQTTYMSSKTAYVFNPQTYQRVDSGVMRCQQTYANIITCGYMMFRNKSHGNKWFYAFIDNAEYINESTTEISYTVDVMQSWMFDYKILPCFIEREHCDDDSIGANIVPEKLDLGTMICSRQETAVSSQTGYDPDLWNIVFAYQAGTDKNAIDGIVKYKFYWSSQGDGAYFEEIIGGGAVPYNPMDYYHNYSPTAVLYEAIPYDRDDATSVSNAITRMWKFLSAVDKSSHGAIVVTAFLIDQTTFAWMNDSTLGGVLRTWKIEQPSAFPSVDQNPAHDLPFSAIKNNKLFTYPYQYLKLDNNQGDSQQYAWERLRCYKEDPPDNSIYTNADLLFALSPSPMVGVIMPYINGEVQNAHNALIFNNFSPVSYSNDAFQQWWALNRNSISMDCALKGASLMISSASMNAPYAKFNPNKFTSLGANISESLVSGTPANKKPSKRDKIVAGGVGSGIEEIATTLAQIGDASALKDNLQNYNTSTNPFLVRYAKQSITAYCYTLTADVAKRIDHYFSVYGYAVNDIKTPNIQDSQGNWQMVRDNWYYVKTVKSYVEGDIPNDVHDEIENIFNTGITFWNDPSHLGDYSYYNWNNGVI